MAGGVGSRLFPLSTPEKPKQFLDVLGIGETLIQRMDRFIAPIVGEDRYAIAPKKYVNLIREQVPAQGIFLENDMQKNTGPCIAAAIEYYFTTCYLESDVAVILPSDAFFSSEDAFRQTISKAIYGAEHHPGRIYCIGIQPDHPSTQYGYIETDRDFNVKRFKEKPVEAVAKEYLASGNYCWNAGIFVGTFGTFMSAFRECAPEIWFNLADWDRIPKISFDYAVLEKYTNIGCIPYNNVNYYTGLYWNDLGSFEAIEKTKEWIKQQF